MAENISYYIFESLSAEEIETLLKLIKSNESNIINLSTISQKVESNNNFIQELNKSLTINCGDSNLK